MHKHSRVLKTTFYCHPHSVEELHEVVFVFFLAHHSAWSKQLLEVLFFFFLINPSALFSLKIALVFCVLFLVLPVEVFCFSSSPHFLGLSLFKFLLCLAIFYLHHTSPNVPVVFDRAHPHHPRLAFSDHERKIELIRYLMSSYVSVRLLNAFSEHAHVLTSSAVATIQDRTDQLPPFLFLPVPSCQTERFPKRDG